jgi:hypothetical protein
MDDRRRPTADRRRLQEEDSHAKAQRKEGAKEEKPAPSYLPLRLGPLAPLRERMHLPAVGGRSSAVKESEA